VLAIACSVPQEPENSKAPPPPIAQLPPPIVKPTPPIDPADVLATKVSVGDFTGPVLDLIEFVRWHHGTPLSFVEDLEDPPVNIYLNNVPVEELLEELLARRHEYRRETILDRIVIYPVKPQYQRIVGNVHIEGVGRWEAMERYVKILQKRYADFRDFDLSYITIGFGGPGPVETDPVTLRPRARVIEHLVQLLGDDRKLVLTIKVNVQPDGTPGGRRTRHVWFDEITVRH